MAREAPEQLLLIVMLISLFLKCVKLKHNTLTLSKVNLVIRVHNIQVRGFHCVRVLGYPPYLLFVDFFLNCFCKWGAFKFSAFGTVGDLSLLAAEKIGVANWLGSFRFHPSLLALLLGYSKAFVIPFFILNCYPLEEIDEEYCKLIPRVTDQRGFSTIPSHLCLCCSSVSNFCC